MLMKLFTHPQTVFTKVVSKDGTSYTKNWVFFKSILPLELRVTSSLFLIKQDSKKRYATSYKFLSNFNKNSSQNRSN